MNIWFRVQHRAFSLLFFSAISAFLFLSPFSPRDIIADQDSVHVGLIGEWNDYGDFHAVKVWSQEEVRQEGKIWVTYAGCATSKGVVIFDIHSKSVSSFIPLGECNDLEIKGTNNGSATYAYVASGETGLYIFNVDNPKIPYYISLSDTPGTSRGVAIRDECAYIADGEGGLQIIDIVNKSRPLIIGSCYTPGYAERVALMDNYALIADGDGGLQIVDITNKKGPEIIGMSDMPGYAQDVKALGNYVYITDKEQGFQVIQLIDPNNKLEPQLLGNCNTPGPARSLALAGSYAYVADEKSGLHIIDISDIAQPVIIGGCITPSGSSDVAIAGNYAYVAGEYGSLQIINIAGRTGPKIIGSCNTPAKVVNVSIAGDYAYVAYYFLDEGGLQIIDISDKNVPEPAGAFEMKFGAYGVTIADNFAYLAGRGGTLQIIDISDKAAPQEKGSCPTGLYTRKVFIEGNYAYVAVGNEKSFYVNDLFNGLKIVDITDPNNPQIVGSLSTPGTAFDVVTEGGHAFVADGVNGLLIIDITDRCNPKPAGNCKVPGSAVAIDMADNYAYIAYWGAGFHIIDIIDPNNPKIVGSYDFHGYATDVSVVGEYAFISDANGGLRVFDIRNKNEPVHLGSCGTPGSAQGVAIAGNYAYIVESDVHPADPNVDDVIWDSSLQIIDIKNKGGPEMTEIYSTPYYAFDVDILGDYTYVADPRIGLNIIHITQGNGPVTVGSYKTPGYAEGVFIAGNYAYVADWDGGLQIIDITNKNEPVFVGSCVLPGYAKDVAIDGNYAYMTDGDFHIVDITDKSSPQIVGNRDIIMGRYVEVSGDYAYVANTYVEGNEEKSFLQIIDISNKNNPQIVGECDTPVYIEDMVIKNDYVYVADGNGGFKIIDARDKGDPKPLGSCSTPGYACGIGIAGNYAYIADKGSGLQIIDFSDPNKLHIVGSFDTPGAAMDVAIAGNCIYVADGGNGILKIRIDMDFPSKGNLILVAGGGADPENALWPATQAQANYIFQTFINNGYESYDIWYQNPVSFQDTDNNGSFNQLVVDDPTPTKAEFFDSIVNWAIESPNSGFLYIYLIGHGAEDRFQIMPNEVLTAQELKECIDNFQNGYMDDEGFFHTGTQRPVVVIIESADSATFIDDLMGDRVTVITSTKDGPNYIKPDLLDSASPFSAPTPPGNQIKSFKSFTTAFIHSLGPYLIPDPVSDEIYLKDAFICARNILQTWILDGLPFSDQVPQMALSGSSITSLDFSENGITPLDHLMIDQNTPSYLAIIKRDSYGSYTPFTVPLTFFSSDPNIISPESVEMVIDTNGIPWYEIKPKKNGHLTLVGFTDPQDLFVFLSAAVHMEVAIDNPEYLSGKRRRAVIVAGYQGTGDYLWESTNTIANHAYRTLRAMGYAKNDIFYYNPYLLQDLDGSGEYDEISGYPHLNALNPDDPYSAFSDIKQEGAHDLLLFFVDHGNQGSFCINPSEALTSNQLMEWIAAVAEHVEEKIVLLYDACYSGTFLKDIEQSPGFVNSLAEKLMVITSTDPNQAAYYLNQGMVSFSYPFFDEWFLTHSLMDAFEYATQFLPYEGQTPLTSDPNIIISWDQGNIYYVDESRPVILDPNITRIMGKLRISAQAYSLTGIKEVWAIVEVSRHIQEDSKGKPITDIPVLPLTLDSDPNYPCGGRYSLIIEDPYPHEPRYNLTLYAKDRGKRPKVTSHKIAIGNRSEHKTISLILTSIPDLFSSDERERLSEQVERAEAILKSKGLAQEDIKKASCLSDLEALNLIEGQTIFVYLIGMIRNWEGSPHFFFNTHESISPEELEDILDPNFRHFILVDAPYAASFLSRINWQKKRNWAGVASTDQGKLFFPIRKDTTDYDYRLFPCYSNFFFSGILSGATLAQAHRMAQNAVSLTRQMPVLFLPEGAPPGFQTVRRYLDYYLGMAAIPGETYSLLGDCSAHVEDGNYVLSLSIQPHSSINKAWAVLASPASFYQKSIIVDLTKDDDQGLLYSAEIPFVHPYYQAYFMVEGRIEEEMDAAKTWTEWREVSIAETKLSVLKDDFEPDDDPNSIRLDPDHLLIVNAPPEKHTFHRGGLSQDCEDIDWIHFYGLKGHIYEIYAQDLSEYGYFIQISLYGPDLRPLHDHGKSLVAINYMAFECPADGFYFLKAKLASSCPPGDVEYIMGAHDPLGMIVTSLLIKVKGPVERNIFVRGEIETFGVKEEVFPSNSSIILPDIHCYMLNGLPSYQEITVKVYERDGSGSSFLTTETSVLLYPRYLNHVTIDITDLPLPYPKIQLPKPTEETEYYGIIGYYLTPFPSNLPYGDMDPNFPPENDYDGDMLNNWEEVLFYGTFAQYPTIPLSLHKGINLFCFPFVYETLKTIPRSIGRVFHYNKNSNKWTGGSLIYFRPDTFNAICASRPVMLYIDHIKINGPVLRLKGFLRPGYSPGDPNPHEYLDTNLFDPSRFDFDSNNSTFEILNHPDFNDIEAISSQNFRSNAWRSSYRFFGRPAGKDTKFDPYDIHVIYKGR